MAQDVSIPSDQMLLHVLPKEFYIDDLDSIREPLGMSGAKLGAHVHLVTCAVTAMQNLLDYQWRHLLQCECGESGWNHSCSC